MLVSLLLAPASEKMLVAESLMVVVMGKVEVVVVAILGRAAATTPLVLTPKHKDVEGTEGIAAAECVSEGLVLNRKLSTMATFPSCMRSLSTASRPTPRPLPSSSSSPASSSSSSRWLVWVLGQMPPTGRAVLAEGKVEGGARGCWGPEKGGASGWEA